MNKLMLNTGFAFPVNSGHGRNPVEPVALANGLSEMKAISQPRFYQMAGPDENEQKAGAAKSLVKGLFVAALVYGAYRYSTRKKTVKVKV